MADRAGYYREYYRKNRLRIKIQRALRVTDSKQENDPVKQKVYFKKFKERNPDYYQQRKLKIMNGEINGIF